MPTQHDHYVRTPGDSILTIYRGNDAEGRFAGGENHHRFGPEHQWLNDAVGVRSKGAPARGPASDGMLGGLFVGEGAEDGLALHSYCWSLMGEPRTMRDVERSAGTHAWALVEPFQQQLFEMHLLSDHGLGWMLEDPRSEPRNRSRIEGLLKATRDRGYKPPAPATTVAEVLANDWNWRAELTDAEALAIRRFRSDVRPGLEVAGYGTLVRLTKEYGPAGRSAAVTGAFHTFEVELKAAVERDAAAVLIMATYAPLQCQFVISARHEAATRAVIDALPHVSEPVAQKYDNQSDPA